VTTIRERLISGLWQGRYTQSRAAELADAHERSVRRRWAAKIREVGTAKGWSTWAGPFMDPDVEFVDAEMPATESIVAELRRLDRAKVLREAAAAVALDRDSTLPGDGAWRRGMTRAGELLRRMADEAGKGTRGGVRPPAGELTQPSVDQTTECVRCGGRIGWIDCPTGGWWVHAQHPADGHDADPGADDFFQPGHTYAYSVWQFRCDTVTTHPATGERSALGWLRCSGGSWQTSDQSEREWADGVWADAAEGAPPMTDPPTTAHAAAVRLAQYRERKALTVATWDSGTERALYEIAAVLAAEVERLRGELEAIPCRAEMTSRIYDALAEFNATAQWNVLKLPQMRQHLAEHLAPTVLLKTDLAEHTGEPT
jgi:hypothetical protein